MPDLFQVKTFPETPLFQLVPVISAAVSHFSSDLGLCTYMLISMDRGQSQIQHEHKATTINIRMGKARSNRRANKGKAEPLKLTQI
jgi:hypothetical protein